MKSSHPLEREELMAYLDGELRPAPAAAAAAHLEHCAVCRAAANDLRELSQQLAAWKVTAPSTEMPAALSAAVGAHVIARTKRVDDHRRSWRPSLGFRRLVWAGGAAIVLLILIIAPKLSQKLTHSKSMTSESLEKYARTSPAKSSMKELQPLYQAPIGNMNYDKKISDVTANLSSSPAFRVDQPSDTPVIQREEKTIPNGPMIVRTAQLSLITKDFNQARNRAEEILKRHGGYIGQLNVNAPEGAGRTLSAVFRVPAAHLDAVLAELKKLGRVTSESQGGEEVTQQYVELEARLANARHTEQRLTDLLRDRTGKLSDVLEFEKEIDRVRGEIESMEAQRKSLAKQVDYATLNAMLIEEYGAPLQLTPPSTSTRFRNAAVEGYQAVAGGIVSVLLFLLSTGPSLLVLGVIFFFLGRLIWKRAGGRIA